MDNENSTAWVVYISLLVLTAVTVGSARFNLSASYAVGAALAIASVKAGVIGWNFMRLKSADTLVRGVVIVGILAVLVMAVGILPDMAYFKK